MERAFKKWVFGAFDSPHDTVNAKATVLNNSLAYLRDPKKVDASYRQNYDTWSETVIAIDGNAVKQYIDYLELKESRESAQTVKESADIANKLATKSVRLALWALVSSGLFGLGSPIVGIWSTLSSPKSIEAPYDVQAIEDRTGTKELEKENDSLRERLYKAEMLISALESEE